MIQKRASFFCDVPVFSISKELLSFARSKGIIINKKISSDEKLQIIKNHVNIALKNDIKSFESLSSFYTFCGVKYFNNSDKVLTLLQENNIDIKSFSYTKGQEFVINSLLSLDIKIELNAFKEFADDILNITTRNLSRNDLGFKARENIFMDFSSKEKTSIVEQALLALLDFKDSLCLLEIKLQILNLGFYLSAKSIIEILEEKDITTKDNIKGILRFAKEFQKLNIIKIEYKEKIPNFNISKDGKIYISKNI